LTQYLRPHSGGDILRDAANIYRQHFITLLLIFVLPNIPYFAFEHFRNLGTEDIVNPFTWSELMSPESVLGLALFSLPTLAMVVAVSDICLGRRPTVRRSYGRLLRKDFALVFLTYFTGTLLGTAGLVLFVVPGLIVLAIVFFVGEVGILEGRVGLDAARRSYALGKGFLMRNLAVLILVVFVMLLYALIVGWLVELAAEAWLGLDPSDLLVASVTPLLESLLSPLWGISITLMYYDMRVRKEHYDTAALAQDLMR
jgi:hypothetical protein